MKIYGIKNCDSCRKALKSLNGAVLVDIRQDGLPEDVKQQAIAQFGRELINTRSTTWRAMPESERQLPGAQLLSVHPTVMKRPLIQHGDRLLLGWSAATRDALGLD